MFLRSLTLIVTLGLHLSAFAGVETETYSYILCGPEGNVLVINKKTGEETSIKVGDYPQSIHIYEHFAFVNNSWSNTVSVIDLKTHLVTKHIDVGERPLNMMLTGNFAYVANFNSSSISVIDLKNQEVIHTLQVGRGPEKLHRYRNNIYVISPIDSSLSVINQMTHTITDKLHISIDARHMVFWKNTAYICSLSANAIDLINLENHTIQTTIPFHSPRAITLYEDNGYIISYEGQRFYVIDLKTQKIKKSFLVGIYPKPMVIHHQTGYVVNEGSHNVSVINLKKNKLIKTLPVGKHPQEMIIKGLYAYIRNDGNGSLSIIDLRHQDVIETLSYPKYVPLQFSNTHLYSGNKELYPLPPMFLLFQRAFTGIHVCELYLDADDAFAEFEQAALKNIDRRARHYLYNALSMGHPKAYAVAFKALCHGLWGATQSDEWAKEFCLDMDMHYLRRIVTNKDQFILLPTPKD